MWSGQGIGRKEGGVMNRSLRHLGALGSSENGGMTNRKKI